MFNFVCIKTIKKEDKIDVSGSFNHAYAFCKQKSNPELKNYPPPIPYS